MTDLSPIAAAILLILGTVGALPVAGAAVTGPADGQAAPAAGAQTDNVSVSVTPGERLAAVVGVQGAEIEGEVERRTFVVRVASADSNASKASVVREQLGALDERLRELEAEKRELDRAHENGSMSTGEYRAKVAKLYTENRAVVQLTNETEAAAAGLPEETLAAKGINVTAIQTLKANASNLTGPEVAEIARSIAGPNVGRQAVGGHAPPVAGNASEGGFDRAENASERGPPEDAGPDDLTGSNATAGNETDSRENGQAPDGDDNDQGGNGGQGGPPGAVWFDLLRSG